MLGCDRVGSYLRSGYTALPKFSMKSTIERFNSKIEKHPSGCWLWIASTRGNLGYGQFHVDGSMVYAHRYSFLVSYGHLPALVMHTCDNPKCVNPSHLVEGSNLSNMLDKSAKGRASHSPVRLDPSKVSDIRKLSGLFSQTVLAGRFGVSVRTIQSVIGRRTWVYV